MCVVVARWAAEYLFQIFDEINQAQRSQFRHWNIPKRSQIATLAKQVCFSPLFRSDGLSSCLDGCFFVFFWARCRRAEGRREKHRDELWGMGSDVPSLLFIAEQEISQDRPGRLNSRYLTCYLVTPGCSVFPPVDCMFTWFTSSSLHPALIAKWLNFMTLNFDPRGNWQVKGSSLHRGE